MPHRNFPGNFAPTPVAFNSVAIGAVVLDLAAVGFTAAEIADAERAVFSTHGTEVHYRYDGGDPSGTVGLMLDDTGGMDVAVVVGKANVANLRFIQESGGAGGTLSVQLEKIL